MADSAPKCQRRISKLASISHEVVRAAARCFAFGDLTVPQEVLPLGKALALADRYRGEGRIADAEALCRGILEAEPNFYEAEHLLGVIAHQTGKLEKAIEHFRRTVELAPQVALHHANLGEMYRLAGKMDEATVASHRALALNPELAEPWNNLALVAMQRRDSKQALIYCRRALALKPDFADAYNNLGNILKEFGELEEARQSFSEAVALNPQGVEAYVNLADLHQFISNDPVLRAMQTLSSSKTLSKAERPYLDFALGKAYRDLKDYRRSFQHILAGNAALRARANYDEKAALAMFTHIERAFASDLIREKAGSGDPSSVPIFILGMPRSGTTLVEQILASHPKVHGAGELTLFSDTMFSVRGPDGRPIASPGSVHGLDSAAFCEIGSRYVAELRKFAPTATHISDKRPSNYYFIGLIHLSLPNAKIIHVVRDAADTCLSCFSKFFPLENQAYDLGELGRYYGRYRRLMAHWHRVLPPGRILDVHYENLVNDLEGGARRMLAHCALPWDECCLAFHKTERVVRTASAVQVRQPVYKTSVGEWRHYQEFIRPLLDALSEGSADTQKIPGGNSG